MLNIVRYMIYPGILLISALGFWSLLETDLPVGISLLIISAANIVSVALLELFCAYDKQWAWWGHRQTLNDIVHGIATSELGPRLISASVQGLVIALMEIIANLHGGGFWPSDWHFAVQMVLAIVIVDFVEWGKHYLYHTVQFLWPIHALHHDIDRLNVTKSMRLHFLEGSVRYLVISVFLTVLGAPIEILLWHTALLTFNGSLNHSNIDMRVPVWAHLMFQTDRVHRLHHSIKGELNQCNLASITTLPDHLFGTYKNPAKIQHGELGIRNNPIPRNLLAQLLAPFIWLKLNKNHQKTVSSQGGISDA